MDTSKNDYDSVMRDFQTYGRGRTLEKCRRDDGDNPAYVASHGSSDQYHKYKLK